MLKKFKVLVPKPITFLKFADDEFKKEKEIILESVTHLKYLDGELKKDKEIILESVTENGYNLKYANVRSVKTTF